jgi:hypothetical protein
MLDTFEIRSETPKMFEMWCWGHTEMISWAESVKNEEV